MAAAVTPLVPVIKTDALGEIFIAGSRCGACGQVFVGERTACARCCGRGAMESFRVARTGTLHSFTIVARSFPGVRVPFIDVTVDMDDGTHLKGTLEGVEPTADAISFDMPVVLDFRTVPGAESEDVSYLTYFFVACEGDSKGFS